MNYLYSQKKVYEINYGLFPVFFVENNTEVMKNDRIQTLLGMYSRGQ